MFLFTKCFFYLKKSTKNFQSLTNSPISVRLSSTLKLSEPKTKTKKKKQHKLTLKLCHFRIAEKTIMVIHQLLQFSHVVISHKRIAVLLFPFESAIGNITKMFFHYNILI